MRAAGVVVIIFTALTVALAWPAERTRDMAFNEWTWDTPHESVPLRFWSKGKKGPNWIYRLWLSSGMPSELRKAESIRLLMATFGYDPPLNLGQIVVGGDCLFETAPGAELKNNDFLEFRRVKPCPEPQAKGHPSDSSDKMVRVLLALGHKARPALWTASLRPGDSPYYQGAFYMLRSQKLLAFGSFRPEAGREMSRARLLGEMWGFGERGVIVVTAVVGLSLLVALGGALLWTRRRVGLATAAFFVSAALVYAVIVPPFQAPDEPDHFLTMTRVTQNRIQETTALALAQRGHFERLKFRAGDQFTVADLEHPRTSPWSKHVRPTGNSRSRLTYFLWPKLIRPVWTEQANVALLYFRLTNALILGLAAFAACRLAVRAYEKPSDSRVFAMALLWAPTVPFFATYFSNYTYLIAGYLLQASALPAVLARKSLVPKAVVGLGAGLAISAYASHSGLIPLVFWIPLLAFKLTAATPGESARAQVRRSYSVLATLIGCYAMLALPLHLATSLGIFPEEFLAFVEVGAKALGISPALPLSAFVLGVLALPWLAHLPAWRPRPPSWLGRAAPWILVLLLLDSAFNKHGAAPSLEGAGLLIPTSLYVKKVLQAFFLSIGFGPSDGLIVRSFYGGYGWLELQLPEWVTACSRVLPAAGMLFLFFGRLKDRRDLSPAVAVAAFVCLLGYLAALAFSSKVAHVTLHGRYLIGFYLFFLQVAFAAYYGTKRSFGSMALAVAGLIQGFAFVFLVDRYF